MSDEKHLRATLIVPADPAAARLVRLMASAIATDVGWDGDALDDVRFIAGELADSLVRGGGRELHVEFEVNGDELVVSGDISPPSDRAVLIDADVVHHAGIVGARTRSGKGHFEVTASRPTDAASGDGPKAPR